MEDRSGKYAAIINVPGYLPECEPEYFDTASQAWEYLASERKHTEDYSLDDSDSYSDTTLCLERLVDVKSPTWCHINSHSHNPDHIGTIYGPSPDADPESNTDLGLAYSVELVERPNGYYDCECCGTVIVDARVCDSCLGDDKHLH